MYFQHLGSEELHRLLSMVDEDQRTLLHNSVSGANAELVQYILAAGATKDVNQADETGWTPLHTSASSGTLPVVKLLLQQGADVHATNSSGLVRCAHADFHFNPHITCRLHCTTPRARATPTSHACCCSLAPTPTLWTHAATHPCTGMPLVWEKPRLVAWNYTTSIQGGGWWSVRDCTPTGGRGAGASRPTRCAGSHALAAGGAAGGAGGGPVFGQQGRRLGGVCVSLYVVLS